VRTEEFKDQRNQWLSSLKESDVVIVETHTKAFMLDPWDRSALFAKVERLTPKRIRLKIISTNESVEANRETGRLRGEYGWIYEVTDDDRCVDECAAYCRRIIRISKDMKSILSKVFKNKITEKEKDALKLACSLMNRVEKELTGGDDAGV
jgi:hypothetical protein